MNNSTHYLMCMQSSKNILSHHHDQTKSSTPPSNSLTLFAPWELQHQFEEPFGGFAWPPRSYTCTFCRREFRSAQALGGHMNVHRRDRARVKQSTENLDHHQKQHVTTTNSNQENSTKQQRGNSLIVFACLRKEEPYTSSSRVSGFKKHKKSSGVPPAALPLQRSSSSVDHIDLELRLGDPPAVK